MGTARPAKKGGVPQAPATFGMDLFAFLNELQANNNRPWFNANKARYAASVRAPALEFIRNMAPRIRRVSKHLTADDRGVGGSLMRVHRDIRFSPDKTPYKTNVGIQFRHSAGRDVHAPGLYVHIEPDDVFVAMGMWRPEPAAQRRIRAKLHTEQGRWRRLINAKRFREHFTLAGGTLKTAPRGYRADHPLIEDLRRTDYLAIADLSPAAVVSSEFEEVVATHLRTGAVFMRFLCEAVGHPF